MLGRPPAVPSTVVVLPSNRWTVFIDLEQRFSALARLFGEGQGIAVWFPVQPA